MDRVLIQIVSCEKQARITYRGARVGSLLHAYVLEVLNNLHPLRMLIRMISPVMSLQDQE